MVDCYSTGRGNSSIYTRVKCVQYGGFTRALHKIRAIKILHELLHAPQLHVNCEYSDEGSNLGY